MVNYTGRGGGGRITPNRPGERRGGRKPGSKNRAPSLVDLVLIAGEKIGDGRGNEGLLEYLKELGKNHPAVFGRFLAKILPKQPIKPEQPQADLQSDEIQAILDALFQRNFPREPARKLSTRPPGIARKYGHRTKPRTGN